MANNVGLPIEMPEIKLEDWWPMNPSKGPPFPSLLDIYWPWYTPPVAEFKVNNLVISPTEASLGQVVTISCTVTNIGAEAGDFTLTLGGDFVAEQQVTLAPGESRTVSFEVVPDAVKTYHVSVDGLTGTFSAIGVADIRVENLVISPAEVLIGGKVTISVQATNYGTKVGSKTIVCTVS